MSRIEIEKTKLFFHDEGQFRYIVRKSLSEYKDKREPKLLVTNILYYFPNTLLGLEWLIRLYNEETTYEDIREELRRVANSQHGDQWVNYLQKQYSNFVSRVYDKEDTSFNCLFEGEYEQKFKKEMKYRVAFTEKGAAKVKPRLCFDYRDLYFLLLAQRFDDMDLFDCFLSCRRCRLESIFTPLLSDYQLGVLRELDIDGFCFDVPEEICARFSFGGLHSLIKGEEDYRAEILLTFTSRELIYKRYSEAFKAYKEQLTCAKNKVKEIKEYYLTGKIRSNQTMAFPPDCLQKDPTDLWNMIAKDSWKNSIKKSFLSNGLDTDTLMSIRASTPREIFKAICLANGIEKKALITTGWKVEEGKIQIDEDLTEVLINTRVVNSFRRAGFSLESFTLLFGLFPFEEALNNPEIDDDLFLRIQSGKSMIRGIVGNNYALLQKKRKFQDDYCRQPRERLKVFSQIVKYDIRKMKDQTDIDLKTQILSCPKFLKKHSKEYAGCSCDRYEQTDWKQVVMFRPTYGQTCWLDKKHKVFETVPCLKSFCHCGHLLFKKGVTIFGASFFGYKPGEFKGWVYGLQDTRDSMQASGGILIIPDKDWDCLSPLFEQGLFLLPHVIKHNGWSGKGIPSHNGYPGDWCFDGLANSDAKYSRIQTEIPAIVEGFSLRTTNYDLTKEGCIGFEVPNEHIRTVMKKFTEKLNPQLPLPVKISLLAKTCMAKLGFLVTKEGEDVVSIRRPSCDEGWRSKEIGSYTLAKDTFKHSVVEPFYILSKTSYWDKENNVGPYFKVNKRKQEVKTPRIMSQYEKWINSYKRDKVYYSDRERRLVSERNATDSVKNLENLSVTKNPPLWFDCSEEEAGPVEMEATW